MHTKGCLAEESREEWSTGCTTIRLKVPQTADLQAVSAVLGATLFLILHGWSQDQFH